MLSATTSVLRRGALASARRMGAGQQRHASTLFSGWTRHSSYSGLSNMERFTRFCPPEAYPLITIATCMCTFGVVTGYKALKKGSDIEELRMSPSRWGQTHHKEVWED